ncbi:MAG TPA: YiiX/YebB-like N1pC/P60 family cysteine hydrolase, partial [Candidatus Binataceae bacterium]|nr:YiiX/YebB-like N1pC/P60 family cysteine hydrolase [Candidatus Binataceae bacterium]
VAMPNDMAQLRRTVRKCDVILVEGNERISECIKYLTQSSWSHSVLYVGDEPIKRNPAKRAEFIEQYGTDADFLVVEALVESGVVLTPLSKYRDFNIRVCRPYNLSAGDLHEVIDEALRHVGDVYDIRNVIDLARYFFPVSLVPRRFRRQALQFGSGEPTRVICSSLLAECFDRVGFPIVPRFAQPPDPSAMPPRRILWRARPRPDSHPYGIMKRVSPTLVTPRDFDLSPYFEIVKFNVIENLRFDYRKILWADDEQVIPEKKPA